MKHLWRVFVLVVLGALVLLAEDFWLKKPYTEWGEKDAAKILKNSPWTHEVSVTLSSGQPMSNTSGGRGGRGGGQGMGAGDASSGLGGDIGGGSGMGDSGMGGGGRGGRGRGGDSEMATRGTGVSMMLRVCWQSALPVRQAQVIAKFGREKADNDEAKKFLAQEVPMYIVEVLDLPPAMARFPAEKLNEIAKAGTSLRIKDKDPIAASGVQPMKRDKFIDFYFLFPKTSPITLDDKEVEFVSTLGPIEVKRKFKLKDMVIGDKLAL